MVLLKTRHPHAGRLERWLGKDKIAHAQASMKGWPAAPIHLLDCPGSVRVTSDGDFLGPFERGYFMSALDALEAAWARATKVSPNQLNVGFASISDALARASSGNKQCLPFFKTMIPVTNAHHSMWRSGATAWPPIGTTPSAAPGGDAPTNATTGALLYTNPASGTGHLTGADAGCAAISHSLLLYDRIFHVAKTINSTATEAVTGVPTRYQSITSTDMNYAGGNFLFVEIGVTALAATAHNWTVCTYTDQDGNTGATLPSVTGVSGCVIDRLDIVLGAPWWCPLATGDTGIKNLTQMQCSALVATGTAYFVIGHPIGFMMFPVINSMIPFDWLTNRDLAPRIFDNACLAFLSIFQPNTTTPNYQGYVYVTNAA
jgi:hypothetical protein